MELPDELIKLFWIKAHEIVYTEAPHRDKNKMCDSLSVWCKNTGNIKMELKIEAFNKALKEYSNVNL